MIVREEGSRWADPGRDGKSRGEEDSSPRVIARGSPKELLMRRRSAAGQSRDGPADEHEERGLFQAWAGAGTLQQDISSLCILLS